MTSAYFAHLGAHAPLVGTVPSPPPASGLARNLGKFAVVSLVRAYGQQSSGISTTPTTLYNVASLAKPITAQVAMLLLSKGSFSLDEPMTPV